MNNEQRDELRTLVRLAIDSAPVLEDGRGLAAWERTFEVRSKWLRKRIDELCEHYAATYRGTVGAHSLTLAGVTATVHDGYAQLLNSWVLASGGFSIAAAGKSGAA